MSCSSHDDALGAATGLGVVVADFELVRGGAVVGAAAAGRVSLNLAVVPPDLPHDAVERLVDVDPRLCRCLNELAAERARERLTLCESFASVNRARGK